MRKSYFIILAVCLSFLFVSVASAEMYGAAKLGYVMTTDSDVTEEDGEVFTAEWDGGFGLGFALGATMENIRVEGELEYRSVDEENTDIELETWSLLANGYYDFSTDSALKPYVGLGLGFARHGVEADDGDDDDTVFAYQGTVGVAWAITEIMDLDFAYRYFATADADFEGTEVEYGSHNLSAGIRFKF